MEKEIKYFKKILYCIPIFIALIYCDVKAYDYQTINNVTFSATIGFWNAQNVVTTYDSTRENSNIGYANIPNGTIKKMYLSLKGTIGDANYSKNLTEKPYIVVYNFCSTVEWTNTNYQYAYSGNGVVLNSFNISKSGNCTMNGVTGNNYSLPIVIKYNSVPNATVWTTSIVIDISTGNYYGDEGRQQGMGFNVTEYTDVIKNQYEQQNQNNTIINQNNNLINQNNQTNEKLDNIINEGTFVKPEEDIKIKDSEEKEEEIYDLFDGVDINAITIDFDSTSVTKIFELLNRIITQNTIIQTMIITILSISIIKLVLGR